MKRVAKAARSKQRQLGQFLTPTGTASRLVRDLPLSVDSTVLEPSFGSGSFILPLIERFMELRPEPLPERLGRVLQENIVGVEIDAELYTQCIESIQERWGSLPSEVNLILGDYFQVDLPLGPRATTGPPEFAASGFDFIVGNPPFGGTFDPTIEDDLDRRYGTWRGLKVKKETYSFFIARSLDYLRKGGHMRFICSDTFLTINTMRGLRQRLMEEGSVELGPITDFDETSQPMLVLDFWKDGRSEELTIDGVILRRESIELSENFSWGMSPEFAKFFNGQVVGDVIVCTGGMTIGKNELFVRRILDGRIQEPMRFEFFEEPITLERELERARLNKLSPKVQEKILAQEQAGQTRRNVRVIERTEPIEVVLPNSDYAPYNKATSAIVYAEPAWAVYWRDEGDAVITFKKNGGWYLAGVGGQKFFGREGLTWQLVSGRINARYLPSGYILDSGAPCGFLRPNVDENELFFILGWLLTDTATQILKQVINHTRNIQGKDVERLPYPWWISDDRKSAAVLHVRALISEAQGGRVWTREDEAVSALTDLYAMSCDGD